MLLLCLLQLQTSRAYPSSYLCSIYIDVVYVPAVRMTSFSRPLVDVLSATLNCLVFDMSKILPTQIDSCSSKLFEGSTLTNVHVGARFNEDEDRNTKIEDIQ